MTAQGRPKGSTGPHARIHRNYSPSRYDAAEAAPQDDRVYVRACLRAGGFPWKAEPTKNPAVPGRGFLPTNGQIEERNY